MNSLDDWFSTGRDEPWIPYSQSFSSIGVPLGYEKTSANQELETARDTHYRSCEYLADSVVAKFANAAALTFVSRSDRSCRHLHLQEFAYLPCMPAFTARRIRSVFPLSMSTIFLALSQPLLFIRWTLARLDWSCRQGQHFYIELLMTWCFSSILCKLRPESPYFTFSNVDSHQHSKPS